MSRPVSEPAPGVRCVVADNPGPMTLDGTRTYLIGESDAVLLDPGPGGPGQQERIDTLVGGRRVAAVCLTHAHPDHAGGAVEVARRLGVALAASAATLARLGLDPGDAGAAGDPDEAVDRPGTSDAGGSDAPRIVALADGDEVEVDGGAWSLQALETPGHSADHLCVFRIPGRDLFTGDLVLGSGTAMVGHPDGHMGSYLASLEKLAELRPSRLLPGHGDPVEEAVERLEEYRRHRVEREEQIRDAVEAGVRSVAEIRQRVYGELPEGLAWAAEASIRAHLEHLEEGGTELPPMAGREAAGGGH